MLPQDRQLEEEFGPFIFKGQMPFKMQEYLQLHEPNRRLNLSDVVHSVVVKNPKLGSGIKKRENG
jgi:hypothetical protein